jgi:retinol-binding protein 3
MKPIISLCAATLAVFTLAGTASAQTPQAPADGTQPALVVEAVIGQMNRHYVFPDVAKKVEAGLKSRLSAKAFDTAPGGDALAAALTDELVKITGDKHIRVGYSAEPLQPSTGTGPSAEEKAEQREMERQHNFGVERVERLPFNIGYVDLHGFATLADAGDTIAAAMSLVANTDALIIDLRQNHGGDPSTVAFALSYLFDVRTHVNDLQWREGGRTEQFWTHDWVPGKRFGQSKPVYVLTSGDTFSGGEEFAYDLKNLKRATLVGEVTGGGANPGDMQPLTAHFEMFVPSGRAVSPITHTNWEGTGVQPDVAVDKARALEVAQSRLLLPMLEREQDPRRKASLQRRLDELASKVAVN